MAHTNTFVVMRQYSTSRSTPSPPIYSHQVHHMLCCPVVQCGGSSTEGREKAKTAWVHLCGREVLAHRVLNPYTTDPLYCSNFHGVY